MADATPSTSTERETAPLSLRDPWSFPSIPNTPLAVAIVAFGLGNVFSLATFTTFVQSSGQWWWPPPQLAFFVAAWSVFHLAEYAVTAGWNTKKCGVDSFLLTNGWLYHAANLFGCLEFVLGRWLWPQYKAFHFVTEIGVVLVLVGQILRSAAMITASVSFAHAVQSRKADDHVLVTQGIYAWFRHPSYAGFFYWSLGTQVVLQNPVAFIGFTIILWRFFNSRIKYEEYALVRFFGQEYVNYRKRVGTRIPFIP